MKSLRCSSCGEDLGVASVPAGQSHPCPTCGQLATNESSATLVVRSNQPDTKNPRGSNSNAEVDTDSDEAPRHTVSFDSPPATGGPAGPIDSELYDFLVPPERPDELGRLGTYRVLKVLGAGGMGVVYEAEDIDLHRRVALKAMLPALAISASARQRFLREARAAAAIEHERIVQIFHVGEDRGIPFLVMPLLKGESLEDRLNREVRVPLREAMRIAAEVAEALAAAHEQGLIHRDIKPGNVWLEGARASVKLLDFGLARTIETNNPLTRQGSIVGTPEFMAPEQAAGEPIDARTDLFSLGCVLYRMSTGWLPFHGTSAVSTLMLLVSSNPMPPREIIAEIPEALSDLIMQLLAKKPAQRPASARGVSEALRAIAPPPDDAIAAPAPPPPPPTATPTEIVLPPPAVPPRSRMPAIAMCGIALVLLLLGAAALLPLWLSSGGPVEIGIAHGTEKREWFNEIIQEFHESPQGQNIKVNLIPMGSVEGGRAVSQDQDQRIHVWSPASSLYRDSFIHEWQAKYPGANPIHRQELLCTTPMVYIFWKERYDLFLDKYETVSFETIAQAMAEKRGWGEIAGKPDWGRFRFGHTRPDQSNSGLATLYLMACDYYKSPKVTVAQLSDKRFRDRIAANKAGLAGTSNSTGNLAKDLVTKGPTAFDAVMVYENLAADYLKAARGRWGDLRVAYPHRNFWNDNPYYILDVPWSSKEQRKAAEAFLAFLLSEPIQKKALEHGFRPANIRVPIRNQPDSPFVLYKANGLQIDIPTICEPPDHTVVDELLAIWLAAK